MPTELFLQLYTKYDRAIQVDVAFFQLCFDHLGFLAMDPGFEVHCEGYRGRDSYVDATFTNKRLRITVTQEFPRGLPILKVERTAWPAKRYTNMDLAIAYGISNDTVNFEERFPRCHPLDALGLEAVRRELHDAVEDRITQFGRCVRENLDRF